MKANELISLEDRFGAKNYSPLDVVLVKGKGIWVWDVEGKKYKDCLFAYSAVNHCPYHVNQKQLNNQIKTGG